MTTRYGRIAFTLSAAVTVIVLCGATPAQGSVTYSITENYSCDAAVGGPASGNQCATKADFSFTLPTFLTTDPSGVDIRTGFSCSIPMLQFPLYSPPRSCDYIDVRETPAETDFWLIATNNMTGDTGTFVGATFDGMLLGTFGSWSVSAPRAFNAASATLTITDPPDAVAPEPYTWGLLLVGFGILGVRRATRGQA